MAAPKSRHPLALVVLAGAAAALALPAHGGFSGEAVWNLAPLFFALLPLVVAGNLGEVRQAVYGFAYAIIGAVIAIHAAYLLGLDLGFTSAARKSLGVPLYVIGGGYLFGMICVVFNVAREGRARKA